ASRAARRRANSSSGFRPLLWRLPALPFGAILLIKGGRIMQTVCIRFLSQEDRVRGFYQLATRARISSLPDGIYQVPIDTLQLLEQQQIAYRRATDAEATAAHDQVRHPA